LFDTLILKLPPDRHRSGGEDAIFYNRRSPARPVRRGLRPRKYDLSCVHIFFISISTLHFGKEILTTEKNKSLSQRTQRFNSGFSQCFLRCVLCGYLFLTLVRCVHTIGKYDGAGCKDEAMKNISWYYKTSFLKSFSGFDFILLSYPHLSLKFSRAFNE